MAIYLNKEQSQILINLAIADLLPKELEKIKKEREAAQLKVTCQQEG